MGLSQSSHDPISEFGVTSVFFPASFRERNIDEEDDKTLHLISQVEGRADLLREERPAVLVSYLDVQQGKESGLIVISSYRIENFSHQYGFRKWQRKYDANNGIPIIGSDWIHHNSQKIYLAIGLSNGKLELLNPSNLELKCSLDINAPSAQPTYIRTPIDNVVLCGYSDGTCRSFFINSGKVGSIAQWPEWFVRVNPFQALPKEQIELYTIDTPSDFTLNRRPCRVTSIAFYRQMNWLIVGYEGYKVLTNKTKDGQTGLLDLSPPIALFSIENGKLLLTCEPTESSILFLHFLKLPSSQSSLSSSTDIFVVGVTPTSFHVWRLPDPSLFQHKEQPLRIRFSNLTVNVSESPISSLGLGRCVSASIDSKDAILFLLFEFGFVASIALSVNVASRTETTQPEELYSLSIPPTPHIIDLNVEYSFYSYDERTQTLMVGDSECRVRLSADVFGRYAATRTLRDIELDRLTAAQQPSLQKEQFIPTIYVGKSKNKDRATVGLQS